MNCKVMGIVNVTPDSFSDGGKYATPEEAVRRVRNLIDEGADIIDLGAESTRPGATPLTWEEEFARLEPVLAELKCELAGVVPFSVDTYHPETAERALKAGVKMVNCVYEEPIPDMLRLCERYGAEIVMPAKAFDALGTVSVPFYIDPMIGFDTTREEDLVRLRSIPQLVSRGRVLVGASRKRIVKKLTGVKTPGKNIAGNLALALFAAHSGASCVRVHDVRETVQVIKVWNTIKEN